MTPALAALVLSALGLAQETPAAAPPPAPPDPAPAATPAPAAQAAAAPEDGREGAAILPLDPRLEAYDQFRAFFGAGRYQDALPLARRVVELSEADPSRDWELPIAYNNLGATQYHVGEYAAAEQSYRKSLEILEASQGISSRRLIVPLAGLGAVYAALDQHAMATEHLERALAVSRRSEGLFNQAQLPIIEQLATSRLAIGDLYGVERERQYSLKIAEQNFGYADARTLPAALRLARFYEEMQAFAAARGLYLRVRDISMAESGGFNPQVVRSLVAICRTHRLQFTIDPDSIGDDEQPRDPITGEPLPRMQRNTRVPAAAPDRSGLKSVESALEILRAASDPPPELLVETLTELGDWYQTIGRPVPAMPYYAEVAAIVARQPEDSTLANPLKEPRMVFYRQPLQSRRDVTLLEKDDVIVRTTAFEFVVTDTGATRDVTVVSSDMKEGQLAQSRRAISRAIYSPRFENGQPVETPGVRFVSDWQELQLDSQPQPASAPGT